MTKIKESDIGCQHLLEALERARRSALTDLPYDHTGPINWDMQKYGNHVTSKGSASAESRCTVCNKSIQVNYNFSPIKATNDFGQPVKLFYTMVGSESISVSGHECKLKRK